MNLILHHFLQYSALIKMYHLATKSYARHKASDKLYDAIQDGMDKFMEVYIGIYGRGDIKGEYKPIKISVLSDKEADELIQHIEGFLTNDIPKHCKHTDLLNIRDEILASVHQVKYLFTLE